MKNLPEILELNFQTFFVKKNARKFLQRPSRMQELYKGFGEGRFESEDAAAKAIYKGSGKSKRFLMLKSRTLDRVLDLFLQHDALRLMKTKYDSAYCKCLRNLLVAQLMIKADMRSSAISLLNKTLKDYKHYHFTDLSLMIYRLLRFNAAFTRSEIRYTYYD